MQQCTSSQCRFSMKCICPQSVGRLEALQNCSLCDPPHAREGPLTPIRCLGGFYLSVHCSIACVVIHRLGTGRAPCLIPNPRRPDALAAVAAFTGARPRLLCRACCACDVIARTRKLCAHDSSVLEVEKWCTRIALMQCTSLMIAAAHSRHLLLLDQLQGGVRCRASVK